VALREGSSPFVHQRRPRAWPKAGSEGTSRGILKAGNSRHVVERGIPKLSDTSDLE
jgi:hypothetical protein